MRWVMYRRRLAGAFEFCGRRERQSQRRRRDERNCGAAVLGRIRARHAVPLLKIRSDAAPENYCSA